MLFLSGCTGMNSRLGSTDAEQMPPGILEHEIRSLAVGGGKERILEFHSPDGFFAMAQAIPMEIEEQMRLKKSWKIGCPVALTDLSYLLLTHWSFDGKPRVGQLVVHRELAFPVIKAFAALFAAHYPIERMELIEKYDADDDRSMAANNTSAFNCRDVTGKPGVCSKHSYGGAIDINPIQNPYITPQNDPLKVMGWDGSEDKGMFLRHSGYDAKSPVYTFCTKRPGDCLVLPPAAIAHAVRNTSSPGQLLPGSAAVKAFTDRGFDWGGSWLRLLDYQHFEYDSAKLQK
jgi:hypothetical protein